MSPAALDASLFHAINDLAGRNRLADAVMVAWARASPVVFALALVALWLTWDARRQRGAFLAGAAALVALAGGQLITTLVSRPRPYDALSARILIPHAADPSFPSDHSLMAFAVAAGVWRVDRKSGAALFALGAWLAVARVFVGVHYPSDVAAGAVLGAASSAVVAWGATRPRVARGLARLFALLRRLHLAAG